MYFVLQVKTRGEEKFIRFAEAVLRPLDRRILWPRRSLRVRRRGRWRDVLAPVFPGYLFIETEEVPAELYWGLKRLPGFIRFLKSNHDIRPLPMPEARILTALLKYGEVVQRSTVEFDETRRIRIVDGPLKELEGRIVKVDKRKGRAKVKLDLYDDSYLVDFGFEALEAAPDAETKGT